VAPFGSAENAAVSVADLSTPEVRSVPEAITEASVLAEFGACSSSAGRRPDAPGSIRSDPIRSDPIQSDQTDGLLLSFLPLLHFTRTKQASKQASKQSSKQQMLVGLHR
jgi:hypothetical protein